MSDVRLTAYRAFVDAAARANADDGYLFDAPRCRFAAEPSDELVAPPGTQVLRDGDVAVVQLANGARLPITGVAPEKVRRVFTELPYRYSRLVIELGPAAQTFMEQAFSRVVFAPGAVAQLEVDLPCAEVVRFPGSPYEVVRSYWRNCIAVRQHLDAEPWPESVAELRELLLSLHRVMLLGQDDTESRSSFYLPASLLGRKRPAPGSFYEAPSGVEARGAENILTSGARVSVPLLGGNLYWQLLAESVSDDAALAAERNTELGGVPHGRLLTARAEDEAQSRPWFLPPRPLTDAHFSGLLQALQAASIAQNPRDAVLALAELHYRFVRVHPLPSANQSLSMSFVNAVLRRVVGAGIPHLLLDQLALRFSLPAYQRLFTRAVRTYCAPWPNAAERMRHLVLLRNELNRFVSLLGNSASLIEARALLTQAEPASHVSTSAIGASGASVASDGDRGASDRARDGDRGAELALLMDTPGGW